MKVFISADIEGITGVTSWDEIAPGRAGNYQAAARQMTMETLAACEAALAAGATEIYVRDGHNNAKNIDIFALPEGVKLIRGWTDCPKTMMAGIDASFNAAIYIGYHAEAGSDGNPLAHTTEYPLISQIKINGKRASEFTLNAYMAAYYGVPSVFISGDKAICESARDLVSSIETVAVKEGIGSATINITPKEACDKIRAGVLSALKKVQTDRSWFNLGLPPYFKMELEYRRHQDAINASYYPGACKIDEHTVAVESPDFMAIAAAHMFLTVQRD